MDRHSHLRHLFSYDNWANREVIGALSSLSNAPQKAVRLMAHVIGTECVWFARLQGQPDPAVWPQWDLAQIAEQQKDIAQRIREYLASLAPDGLEVETQYTNTRGETWKNSVADILTHVAMHSAYHRGQIAMVLRDNGIAPPYTDYIQAVRTRQIRE